jgi:hypothetical protein
MRGVAFVTDLFASARNDSDDFVRKLVQQGGGARMDKREESFAGCGRVVCEEEHDGVGDDVAARVTNGCRGGQKTAGSRRVLLRFHRAT